MLILRQQRAADQQSKVLFINAEDLMKKRRNQNTLEPERLQELLEAYASLADIDGRARVVDLEEIESSNFNLNIPLYVAPADSSEKPHSKTHSRILRLLIRG